MNYQRRFNMPLIGQSSFGGQSMTTPFCKLTIGDMYKNTSGYISSLTYTVQDMVLGKRRGVSAKVHPGLSKHVGDRLPSKIKNIMKLLGYNKRLQTKFIIRTGDISGLKNKLSDVSKLDSSTIKKFTKGL